jgi:hypothetical protein
VKLLAMELLCGVDDVACLRRATAERILEVSKTTPWIPWPPESNNDIIKINWLSLISLDYLKIFLGGLLLTTS